MDKIWIRMVWGKIRIKIWEENQGKINRKGVGQIWDEEGMGKYQMEKIREEWVKYGMKKVWEGWVKIQDKECMGRTLDG